MVHENQVQVGEVMKLKISEASVKSAVEARFQIAQNQGQLVYLRLNSGELIAMAGESRRRIKLCPTGTADFVVFQGMWTILAALNHQTPFVCRVTFLEIKSSTGKQSPDQKAFQQSVEQQNCRYYLVNDASQLEEILK